LPIAQGRRICDSHGRVNPDDDGIARIPSLGASHCEDCWGVRGDRGNDPGGLGANEADVIGVPQRHVGGE
jgi:hypothetical protein